jgi:hypothetical protein
MRAPEQRAARAGTGGDQRLRARPQAQQMYAPTGSGRQAGRRGAARAVLELIRRVLECLRMPAW